MNKFTHSSFKINADLLYYILTEDTIFIIVNVFNVHIEIQFSIFKSQSE